MAEMTGRRGRLVRKNGVLKYDLRPEDQETRCVHKTIAHVARNGCLLVIAVVPIGGAGCFNGEMRLVF